ncbi:MAG: hypothetical protein H6981_07755 [Gammaproteobacteria bacterium]|nr:hypothetical protein [Gammaproteobacteria bacterium]MCP5136679.1 hypothetical protein [Gammaproteobacteria bacterium]
MNDELSIRKQQERKAALENDEAPLDDDSDLSGLDWDIREPEPGSASSAESQAQYQTKPQAKPRTEPRAESPSGRASGPDIPVSADPMPKSEPATDSNGFPTLAGIPETAPELPTQSDDAMPFAFPGMGEDEEAPSKGSGLDIQRLLKGIWSRRKLVTLIAGTITVLFLVMAMTLVEKKWLANVTMIKRSSQDEFQIGKFGKPFKPQTYNLQTLLDTLLLPSVLQETVRRSGIDLQPRKLVKYIEAQVGKESTIFQIKVTWKDPNVAAEIANNLVDIFIARNREIRRADAEETLLYYSNQLQSAQQTARQTNAELQSFQEEYQISDLETEITVLVGQLTNLETEQKALQAEVEATRKDLTRLEAAIETEPEMIVQSSYYVNPLQKNLSDLEWELEQARGRYTDENPKVKDLKTRIATIKGLIEKGGDSGSPSNTYANNPVRQELTVKRYQTTSDYKQREARLGALDKLVKEMRDKLNMLTAKKQENNQLKAKVDSIELLADNLRNRVEEARVLMLRNESDFDIIERARPPDEAEPSGRKTLAILGVILGGGLGLMIALLQEFLDKRVRTRREAQDLGEGKLTFEFQKVPESAQIVVDTQFPGEPVVGIFRRMANDMDGTLEAEDWQSLALVSPERQTGRSLVATNLAQALALKERHVVLVDADLGDNAGERPVSLYELNDPHPGLIELLAGDVQPDDVLGVTENRFVRVVRPNRHNAPDGNAIHLLGSIAMADLIDRLKRFPGHVIYDLPPATGQETVVEAIRHIGNALVVVRSGQTPKPDIRDLVERLIELGVTMQATVITEVPEDLVQEKPVFEPQAKSKAKVKSGKGTGLKLAWPKLFRKSAPPDTDIRSDDATPKST